MINGTLMLLSGLTIVTFSNFLNGKIKEKEKKLMVSEDFGRKKQKKLRS